MLRDFTWTEKYDEVMSNEHPPSNRMVSSAINDRFDEWFFTALSSFLDVKKQRPKTNLEKCYQCSVSI